MEDLVSKEDVFFDNPSKTVDAVLEFLSDKAVELGVASDREAVLASFREREAQGSTGMVGGFALPHAKSAAIERTSVMVVKFSGEVDWKSMDGEPIKAAIAIFTPTDPQGGVHLAVLAKIASMLMQPDFCSTILGSDDAEAIADAINERLAD